MGIWEGKCAPSLLPSSAFVYPPQPVHVSGSAAPQEHWARWDFQQQVPSWQQWKCWAWCLSAAFGKVLFSRSPVQSGILASHRKAHLEGKGFLGKASRAWCVLKAFWLVQMKFLSLHQRWGRVFHAAYLPESTWFDKIGRQLSKSAGMRDECSAWTVPAPAAQAPAAPAAVAGNIQALCSSI